MTRNETRNNVVKRCNQRNMGVPTIVCGLQEAHLLRFHPPATTHCECTRGYAISQGTPSGTILPCTQDHQAQPALTVTAVMALSSHLKYSVYHLTSPNTSSRLNRSGTWTMVLMGWVQKASKQWTESSDDQVSSRSEAVHQHTRTPTAAGTTSNQTNVTCGKSKSSGRLSNLFHASIPALLLAPAPFVAITIFIRLIFFIIKSVHVNVTA